MMRYMLCAAALAAAVAERAWSADTAEQRLRDVEQRLDRLENAPVPTASPPPNPTMSPTAFNPAISLILSGIYTNLSQDPADFHITGFPVPEGVEIGPGSRGFSLAESELAISANIDPDFYGMLTFSIHPDDTVSSEEAFIQTISLSHGFTVKGGRFFSGIGYLNAQHAHTWDFVDAPLAYQAFLGTQFGDDGVQLRWLAPTDLFIELGAELGRGRPFPGTDRNRNGAGSGTVFGHVGGDVGVSHSWRAGLSLLSTSPQDRVFPDTDIGGNPVTNSFSGDTRIWIADLVWKYAPNGDPTRTNFKLQAEYLHRHENGELTFDVDPGGAVTTAPFDSKQSGWYLQGVYQFMPYWRVGLRTEQLNHGRVDFSTNSANLAQPDFNPSKNTVMVDYNPSEFSRIRLQYARDDSRQGATDNQWWLQYQMSLGAHGAHQF
ncbi:MAG: hypothetical protein ACJ8KA_06195 [Sulfurifustis sp.]